MGTHNQLLYFPGLCAGSTPKIAKTYSKELCQVSYPFPSINYGKVKRQESRTNAKMQLTASIYLPGGDILSEQTASIGICDEVFA